MIFLRDKVTSASSTGCDDITQAPISDATRQPLESEVYLRRAGKLAFDKKT